MSNNIYKSATKWSMTEGPISSPILLTKLMKYPLSRLAFITIKDNSQSTRWTQIGKVNDWIRRYSDAYAIVMGTVGGQHFHILAGINKKQKLTTRKGVHFDIQYLSKKKEDFPPDYREIAHNILDQIHVRRDMLEELFDIDDVPPYQQDIILCITALIKSYYVKKANKQSRDIRQTKKGENIDNILNYLQKNLDEYREDSIRQYTDYITKY